MPLPKKGLKGANGAKTARSGQAQAARTAQAAAKPKAKAKPYPWERQADAMKSATERKPTPKGGGTSIHKVDHKKAKEDPVYGWGQLEALARNLNLDPALEFATRSKQQALQEQFAAMPPTQKVDHLKKQLRTAEAELQKRIDVVEATEDDIDRLQQRLKAEVAARDDQQDVVSRLALELQEAEAQVPPAADPRPVGRQLQAGDQGIKEGLRQLKAAIEREAGGRLTTELDTDFEIHSAALLGVYNEIKEVNEARAAQEAEDRKMALRVQARELQTSGKHARDDQPHDHDGDDVMSDAHNKEALEEDWQQRQSRCRRTGSSSKAAQATGPTPSPTGPQSDAVEAEAAPSTTAPTSAQAMGPLATVSRGRAQDRDRTPRRAKAAGTPAAATATGTLQEPSATEQKCAGTPAAATTSGLLNEPPTATQPSTEANGEITPAVSSSVSSLSPSPQREGQTEGVTAPATAQAVGGRGGEDQPNGGGVSAHT